MSSHRPSPTLRIALVACALLAAPAFAQDRPSQPAPASQAMPDPATLIAAQKAALARLAFLDGTWRGTARTTMPDGSVHVVTQTERIGPLLDGAIRLIEGRGYNADGSTGFNAFAVLGWDVRRQAYTFRSHAMGNVGDFAFRPNADGFVWEIPAGPTTLRYTATVKDQSWHEVGDRILPDGKAVRFFEMRLRRIGDSTWPAAGAVPAH